MALLLFQGQMGCPSSTRSGVCELKDLITAISDDNLFLFKKCAQSDFDFHRINEKEGNISAMARKQGRIGIANWLKEFQYTSWKKEEDQNNVEHLFRALIAMATMFEQKEILGTFIQHGADVNDPDVLS